jgi:transposase
MGRYMTTQDYEEALFKIDPVFRKLRDLKEIYIRFNNRYVGKPKEAAAGLRAVIQHYRNSDQKIFYKYIADTLEEYFDEITNSFIVIEKYSKNGKYAARLSNGPMESLNRIPKDLKRNARGYRNFEHIRQRFLFSQRSSAAVRANPKPLEEVIFKSNIKRGPYVKKAYRADCIDKFF